MFTLKYVYIDLSDAATCPILILFLKCLVKFHFFVNPLPQLQRYGFKVSWIYKWLMRWTLIRNSLKQIEHLCGRRLSLCTVLWKCSTLLWRKDFPQSEHWYGLVFVWILLSIKQILLKFQWKIISIEHPIILQKLFTCAPLNVVLIETLFHK